MKKICLIGFLLLIYLIGHAQYFQTGQDPASIKWRHINTKNFQLIYPDYYEDQAQILAQKLEKVYEYASYSLQHKPAPISIILHTQTVQSNGLVAYAPKRSEFYTTPNQAIYPLDWLEQLAVHEFRHVVQIDKVNSEIPGVIKFLLGEQGTALVFGAYLPWWFIEGDAVVTETALSNYGRGRLPSFLIEHRAQVNDKGIYSYDKAYLGSYKDYVPNHYQMGYYMVANSRQRYGSDVWEKVLTRVGEKPFSLTPFNKALKRETGNNKVQLYNSIFDSLAYLWNQGDKLNNVGFYSSFTNEVKTYTNYTHNHWLNEDELISYKTAYNQIPSFVKIDLDGNEKVIHRPGYIFKESISYQDELVVWSEQVPDLRWSHSGRSLLKILNTKSELIKELKPEYKAFAPSISPNQKLVAMVEADFSSNYYLSVYNIETKENIHRIKTDLNHYLFSPRWLNNNELLIILLTDHGKRFAKVELESGNIKILYDFELGNIKHPVVAGDDIFFIGSYGGKDELYSLNIETGNVRQIMPAKYGLAYPAINQSNKLVISDYTSDGYCLAYETLEIGSSIEEVEQETFPLATDLTDQEMGVPDLSPNDTLKYPSEKYSKLRNLINFHSWSPVFVDPYRYEFYPGVSFMSQNVLGTAESVLGYRWYSSEKTGQFYGRYTYKGWYPVFDFEFSHGKRSSQFYQITENIENGQVVSRDTSLNRYTWKESSFSAISRIPLNLSKGKYIRLLQPQVGYEYTLQKDDSSTPESFPRGNYQSFFYRLYYHQLLRKSYQDVLPNFGFIVDAAYYHSPIGSKNLGKLSGVQAILYVPGAMKNHGIKLYGGIQSRTNGDHYSFSDIIRFPRGWAKVGTKNLNVLNVEYQLPLLNPDLSIGGLSYVRRINTNLFFDYGRLSQYRYNEGQPIITSEQSISTWGIELIADLNFLRFYAPIEIGVRSSYLKEIDDYSIEFLFSVDFNSL